MHAILFDDVQWTHKTDSVPNTDRRVGQGCGQKRNLDYALNITLETRTTTLLGHIASFDKTTEEWPVYVERLE